MLKRDPTDLRIFAMRKQGSTLAEIAQAVELASSTVRNRLLQSGKFPRRLQNGFPQ
jgi:lambda repressor-like predicted transcriptional regulator